jgi:hypothetical protein
MKITMIARKNSTIITFVIFKLIFIQLSVTSYFQNKDSYIYSDYLADYTIFIILIYKTHKSNLVWKKV